MSHSPANSDHNKPRKPNASQGRRAASRRPVAPFKPAHPILERLAPLYPALFGAQPLPLKRGIFEDLVAANPEWDTEDLKQGLAIHTRSTRYLQAVSMGRARHDLQGQAVEPMAVEHSFHALTELFRRKLRHAERAEESQQAPLRAQAQEWLEHRLTKAVEHSGLRPSAYAESVHTRDAVVQATLTQVVQTATEQQARDEAMLRAYEASGSNVAAFAEMYGLTVQEAGLMLARARLHQQQRQEAEHATAQNAESSESTNMEPDTP
ncbi:hypothetical protein E9531_04130 [Lampropedia puyangensis]|uniref:ProQ/FinO domain-containing protein n=1 Tax=Lampropedia puyangensis TaxID=1330072 RepID=A0A4S8FBC4_9BURK|nr:ProQ/FINO family protein [Lampropedia puyangensis]THU04577.1 hypothetical protein E9531_04130 [Lampropedia puyangensis]